ncbi:hypothetical protein LPMP_312100 [Leishmania panamensis]|uniref:Uncharacterized protein n=1 Tax=Leishmania panamensis TaxID=5679 RepID=A0A088RXB9_LEIPA|nr:hypothetical protein LPMP_312100 [Leishmania panamensis]AIO00798.1 hypothetical protein LPMP_312100 [Leishmania panamensis]
MSLDSGVNAALLNLCAQLQDGGTANTASEGPSALHCAGGSGEMVAQPSPSASAGAATPAPAPSTAVGETARPASDYEWLRNALASVEAPEKRVKQLLFNMENRTTEGEPGPLTPEEQLEALAELADMVEDVNWAAEFALMQGPQRLLQVLRHASAAHPLLSISGRGAAAGAEASKSTDAETKEESLATPDSTPSSVLPFFTALALVIAHSAQLNAPVQAAYQAAHWEDTLPHFMGDCVKAVQALLLLGSDRQAAGTRGNSTEAANVVTRATSLMRLLGAVLHACSCLCRDYPPNTIVFLQSSGLAVIVDTLRLTRTLLEIVLGCTRTDGGAPAIVTHISSGAASDEEADDIYAPLLGTAHKVTARAFFFVTYLASAGVSSEEVIQLACLHAESCNSNETIQKAAARALTELMAKSPNVIKEAVQTLMPHRLKEWRTHLQRTVGDEEMEDERRHFVDVFDKVS